MLNFLQYGKTKLFFNKSAMDRLDRLTRDSQRKVTTAQSGNEYTFILYLIFFFLLVVKSMHIKNK